MKAKIACLALFTSALFSNDVLARVTVTTHKLECQRGNFYGELMIEKRDNSENGVGTITFTPKQYMITKFYNQQGGNKANINITTKATDNFGQHVHTERSPDNRKQDGQWHDSNMRAPAGFVANTWQNWNRSISAEFIFDKSGSDPRCTATYSF